MQGLDADAKPQESFFQQVRAFCRDEQDLRAELATLKKAETRRKVVQLIVLPLEGRTCNEVYALCDDGTMWRRYEGQEWLQILGIPQPEQPEQLAQTLGWDCFKEAKP
jgi:hypothetical protein